MGGFVAHVSIRGHKNKSEMRQFRNTHCGY
nr:MAG TPA: hypothetical protein [Crassvirales sp.]